MKAYKYFILTLFSWVFFLVLQSSAYERESSESYSSPQATTLLAQRIERDRPDRIPPEPEGMQARMQNQQRELEERSRELDRRFEELQRGQKEIENQRREIENMREEIRRSEEKLHQWRQELNQRDVERSHQQQEFKRNENDRKDDKAGGLLGLILILLAILWIWALQDCLGRKTADFPTDGTHDKVVWILVLILTLFIGAILYLFLVQGKPRSSEDH